MFTSAEFNIPGAFDADEYSIRVKAEKNMTKKRNDVAAFGM